MSDSGTKSLRKPLRFWGWRYADEDLHPGYRQSPHISLDPVSRRAPIQAGIKGPLGIITEATMRLQHRPKWRAVVIADTF